MNKNYLWVVLLIFSSINASQVMVNLCKIGYVGTLIVDTATKYFPSLQNMVYSNGAVSHDVSDMIAMVSKSYNCVSPQTINESRSMWNLLLGSSFSHHNTLYISNAVHMSLADAVKKGDVLTVDMLDSKSKTELITSFLMIHNRYDDAIMKLAVAVPCVVWAASWIMHYCAGKIDSSVKLPSCIKKCASLTKEFYQSFQAKVLLSACLLGIYMVHQRYQFLLQAQSLL